MNSEIIKKSDQQGDRRKVQHAQSPLTLAHGAPRGSSGRSVLYSANSTIRQPLAEPRTVRLWTWPVGGSCLETFGGSGQGARAPEGEGFHLHFFLGVQLDICM